MFLICCEFLASLACITHRVFASTCHPLLGSSKKAVLCDDRAGFDREVPKLLATQVLLFPAMKPEEGAAKVVHDNIAHQPQAAAAIPGPGASAAEVA